MVVKGRSWFGRLWDRLVMPPKKVRPMGLIAVQMSINPFEFYLLVAVCIVGILYMLGFSPPSTVAQLLPPVAVKVWAVNLGMGGLAAFIGGMWRRNLERGLLAYQFGWILVAIACFIYGVAVMVVAPQRGIFTGISNLLWSVACLTRVLQVQRFFKLSEQMITGGLHGSAGGLGSLLEGDKR